MKDYNRDDMQNHTRPLSVVQTWTPWPSPDSTFPDDVAFSAMWSEVTSFSRLPQLRPTWNETSIDEDFPVGVERILIALRILAAP